MRSISSDESLFPSFLIWMFLDVPELFSTADTSMIPSAEISNVTKICGVPRGAGGIPSSKKLPRRLLSLVIARSPSNT